MGQPIKVRTKITDGIAEIKALMPHEMESGFRRDAESGELIPGHFITEVVARHNGERVMTAYWGPAVAKNPYVSFSFGGAKAGDTIELEWKDNKGDISTTMETL